MAGVDGADKLEKFLARPHDLAGSPAGTVRLMAQMERRAGEVLFREMLARRSPLVVGLQAEFG
jgi:hypothetical protein